MRQIRVHDLADTPDTDIVDVREVVEFRTGHLPGAVTMPMSLLPLRYGNLSADRTVVCQVGARSPQAAQALSDAVAGGTQAGIDAGYPDFSGESGCCRQPLGTHSTTQNPPSVARLSCPRAECCTVVGSGGSKPATAQHPPRATSNRATVAAWGTKGCGAATEAAGSSLATRGRLPARIINARYPLEAS